MGTKVAVDPDLCIGSAECNRIAGQAFRLDEESGVSVVLPAAATTDPAVLVRAKQACPTQAIRLRRGDEDLVGGQS